MIDALGLKQLAEDGNIADARDFFQLVGGAVIQQSGDREALAALQLDLSFSTASRDCRNGISGDRDFIRIIQGADFGRDLHHDGAVGQNGGREVNLDAVRAELNCDRRKSTCATLYHRVGELAAGEKGRLFSADGGECGLGEDLSDLLILERLDGRSELQVLVVIKEPEEAAQRQQRGAGRGSRTGAGRG